MTQLQVIKPAYEVHPFSGTTKRRVYGFDKKSRQLTVEEVDAEGGYMVYFPKGHSIRVFDDEHLKVLGFDQPAKLIDMETGEESGEAHGSLRQHSRRVTRRTKSGENLDDGKEASA